MRVCGKALLLVAWVWLVLPCLLRRHAATGTLVPGKSTGAPRKTTPHQDHALWRMVWQDRFISARTLMKLAGKASTTSSWPVVIMPIDPQGIPVVYQPPPSLLGMDTAVAEPDNGPLAACHLWWHVKILTLPDRWQDLGTSATCWALQAQEPGF